MTTALYSPTRAFQAFLLQHLDDLEALGPSALDHIGGAYRLRPGQDFYIQITLAPGGAADILEGTSNVYVDVWSWDYLRAESLAFTISALALRYPHVVEVDEGRKVVFDMIEGGVPAPRPTEDEGLTRFETMYAVTTRRT